MGSIVNPTVVIVPGAWEPAKVLEPFAELLRSVGHPTEVVPLLSVGGTETPLAGLKEDVEAVREVLTKLADEARDIVLLCHSYGGVVGSCAVEGMDAASRSDAGKAGGVIMTVYMSAFMLPKGTSVLEGLGGDPLPWMNLEGDKVTVDPSAMPQIAWNDMPLEEAIGYSKHLTHTSASVFASPSSFEPWANGVPCAFIFCELDKALPLPVQQQMASQLGPNATTYSLQAGHCPFLSMPEQMRDVVVRASEVGLNRKVAV